MSFATNKILKMLNVCIKYLLRWQFGIIAPNETISGASSFGEDK